MLSHVARIILASQNRRAVAQKLLYGWATYILDEREELIQEADVAIGTPFYIDTMLRYVDALICVLSMVNLADADREKRAEDICKEMHALSQVYADEVNEILAHWDMTAEHDSIMARSMAA